MRNPGRWPAVAAILAAGMLAGTVAAVAAVPVGTAPRGDTKLRVVAKRGVFSLAGAPAIGVGFIAGGDLFDSGGANKIGSGYSHCGIVNVDAATAAFTADCTTVFVLPGGQLHMSSLRSYSTKGFTDSKFAIIGGTEQYRTARGDGTGTLSDAATHTYTFDLTITS